jgi:hypothetical protein
MDFKRKIKKVLLIGAAVEGLGCIAVGAWWLLGAPVILAILGGFALVGGTTMVVIAPLTLRSIFGSAVKNVRFESPGT